MELGTLCLFVIALSGIIPTAFTQHSRKKIQSETRIKLPSDIAFTHESSGDVEGEACFNLVRAIDGICTLPMDCPEVIRDFQKGIQPQICNYKGHLPIICCPRSQKPVIQPSGTQSTILQTTAHSNSPISTSSTSTTYSPPVIVSSAAAQSLGDRISEQKCKEYMKLMIEESVVTTLSLNPENRTVQKTKCAKPSSEGFIVGGTRAEPGEFPHMAVIGWQQDENSPIEWNCGGSLIRYAIIENTQSWILIIMFFFSCSYRFVLSAAHCMSLRGIRPKIIRLGEHNLKHKNSRIEDFGISLSIRHPKYRANSKYHDIALFQLDRNVRISDFIKPACLWQKFDVHYRSGIATGWGLTRDRGRQSEELLKVQLNFISNERCNGFYQRFQALKDGIINTQICAGDDIEEKDTCNGDSG